MNSASLCTRAIALVTYSLPIVAVRMKERASRLLFMTFQCQRGGLLVNKLRDMSHPGSHAPAPSGARADLIATRMRSSLQMSTAIEFRELYERFSPLVY